MDKKILEFDAEIQNAEIGNMNLYDGIKCEKCKNKGYIAIVKETELGHYLFARECECMPKRRLFDVMKTSGLGDMLKIYKLINYSHNEKWQDNIYNKAINFIREPSNCFYIGGQVGCGKSHICTAVVGELVKVGETNVKYAVWNNLTTLLKQNMYEDFEEYNSELNSLKNAKILFIDDFFKNEVSKADIKNAFDIINYRYNLARSNTDDNYLTIISSEKTINEILQIDEAVGSRIIELAKEFILTIPKDLKKNYRLNFVKEFNYA